MSLQDEKAAALAEILSVTGEEVLWNGQTYQALVSDNPLSDHLILGGFQAKGECTVKIPRSAFGEEKPRLGQEIQFQETDYRITRVTDHAAYPMIVLLAEPIE
jgi:hypothetical protein